MTISVAKTIATCLGAIVLIGVAPAAAMAAPHGAPTRAVSETDHFDGVRVDRRDDDNCTALTGDNQVRTATCTGVYFSQFDQSEWPALITLPSHDYTVKVEQVGGAHGQWNELDSEKKSHNSGSLDSGSAVLRGSSFDYNGTLTDAAWYVGLSASGRYDNARSNVKITITYTPEQNHVRYVNWTTGGKAKCRVNYQSDHEIVLDCSDVHWNVVGNQVNFFLPSNKYSVDVQLEASASMKWAEQDWGFTAHNSGVIAGAQGDGVFRGGTVESAWRDGWHLGLDSDDMFDAAHAVITISYNG